MPVTLAARFGVYEATPKTDMKVMGKVCLTLGLLLCLPMVWAAPVAQEEKRTLDIYVIDVEGGEATLFVSPSGESMLVDTGWPGFDDRDADRIAVVAQQAGVDQIDYLLVTHFHTDHMGGALQLADRLPIRHFVDSGSGGENLQSSMPVDALGATFWTGSSTLPRLHQVHENDASGLKKFVSI